MVTILSHPRGGSPLWFELDPPQSSGWMLWMKTIFLAGVLALMVTGCVSTVTGEKTAGIPFISDTYPSLYRRPPEVIFQAARQVIVDDGVLTNEGSNYNGTNEVRFVKGKVNECSVWISIAPAEQDLTKVMVQVRRSGGGSNLSVAHQIDKEIAVKLARQ